MGHKIEVCKSYTFEASHELPYHKGKCRRLHGHSYKLMVCFMGEVQEVNNGNPESGMVVDFERVNEAVKAHIENFDHQYLNNYFDYPTAEGLVLYFVIELNQYLNTRYQNRIVLNKVRLHETEKSYVEWRRSEQF